jgi:hypothetical protein
LPENEIDLIGKVLCNYFQNVKDEFNILNVIKISKGLSFTKKLMESQFKPSESEEKTNLLFSSLNFNKNCLNLFEFCFKNFKNDSTTLEKILEFRDEKNLNFIQIVFNSCSGKNSMFDQRTKFLQKIFDKFEFMRKKYGIPIITNLANSFFGSQNDLNSVSKSLEIFSTIFRKKC